MGKRTEEGSAKRRSAGKTRVVVHLPPARQPVKSADPKVPFCSYTTPQALALLAELRNEEGVKLVELVSEALNLLFLQRGKRPVA